jgi:Glyoxalase superfamily protein/Clp amino terminal domain, pathogenicity island component
MKDMRDFRHAKAMARTLRASLAARGFKITVSQSLDLISEAFGMADWNTLSATIRAEAAGPRNNVSPPQFPTAWGGFAFSAALESTLHRAIACSNQRKHKYTTLEHLLFALIDDVDASAVMTSCKVDLGELKEHLVSYIDNDLKKLVVDDGESETTAAFQRVIQRAVIHVLSSGREEVTGANILVAIFAERESPAAYFLQEQEMTRDDAVNYIRDGIKKGDGDTAV